MNRLNPTFPGDGSEKPDGTGEWVECEEVLILLSLEMVLRTGDQIQRRNRGRVLILLSLEMVLSASLGLPHSWGSGVLILLSLEMVLSPILQVVRPVKICPVLILLSLEMVLSREWAMVYRLATELS